MELVGHAAPYKLQETSGYMKGCSGSSSTGLLTENLFGQHDVDCLYQQVWGNTLLSPHESGSPDLEFMPENGHSTSPVLRPIILQTRRQTLPAIDETTGNGG